MKNKITTIESSLSAKEVTEKLRSITITDSSRMHISPHASYYGDISNHNFDIMNVRYGPMSSFPPIQGDITEGVNKTTIKIRMDVESRYKIVRGMYFATLIPTGLIVLLLSIMVLGGTEYQVEGYIFSASFIACAFLAVAITKVSLINTRKKELNIFADKVMGRIIFEHIEKDAQSEQNGKINKENGSKVKKAA